MPPNTSGESTAIEPAILNNQKSSSEFKLEWRNIAVLGYIHIGAIFRIYSAFTSAKLLTILYGVLLIWLGIFGTMVGTHRYWSHRTFKATKPLEIILFVTSHLSFQGSIINWSRDHRSHHKFCDTDADPVNPAKGYFFAHIGWLLLKRHPEVHVKGRTLDHTDLTSDPLLQFQKKHYIILAMLINLIFSAPLPMYLWNETFLNALFVSGTLRICAIIHVTLLINSLGHSVGTKPYNTKTSGVQNTLNHILTIGEGWHNFHHAFPRDYRHGEFGGLLPSMTRFIDLFEKIGWAYDLKATPQSLIDKTKINVLKEHNSY